jgi:hypothetical protein
LPKNAELPLNDQLEPLRLDKKNLEEKHTKNSIITGSTFAGVSVLGATATIIVSSTVVIPAAVTVCIGFGCAATMGIGVYVAKQIYSSRTTLEKIKTTNINPKIDHSKFADKAGTEVNKWMSNLHTNLQIVPEQDAIRLLQKIRDIWSSANSKKDEYLKIHEIALSTYQKLQDEEEALKEGLKLASELHTGERIIREQPSELTSPLFDKLKKA